MYTQIAQLLGSFSNKELKFLRLTEIGNDLEE